MVAVLVARFTRARSTPAVFARVRSMVRAHDAQVMPETGRSTRSGAAALMPALRSPTRARRQRASRVSPRPRRIRRWPWRPRDQRRPWLHQACRQVAAPRCARNGRRSCPAPEDSEFGSPYIYDDIMDFADALLAQRIEARSEEHTSELQ